MQLKNFLRPVIATAVILIILLLAMQFTPGVAWSVGDFIAAAALLMGAGLLYEFAATKYTKPWQRVVIAASIAAVLAVVWLQLAVGII